MKFHSPQGWPASLFGEGQTPAHGLGVKLERQYDLNAPRGVAGRNSDNTFIQKMLKWEPDTPLETGLRATYKWIKTQYNAKKAGKRVVD